MYVCMYVCSCLGCFLVSPPPLHPKARLVRASLPPICAPPPLPNGDFLAFRRPALALALGGRSLLATQIHMYPPSSVLLALGAPASCMGLWSPEKELDRLPSGEVRCCEVLQGRRGGGGGGWIGDAGVAVG